MKKRIFYILIGIVIVALGLAYAGSVLGFWEFNFSLNGWWTLFIIMPCITSIFTVRPGVFNCTGLIVGLLMLLSEQGVLENNLGYNLIFPVIIVAVGVGVIFKRSNQRNRKDDETNGIYAGSNGENFFAIFGGNSPNFRGKVFSGANTYAIFGGVDLYLQESTIKRDCVINVYSVFGGTDIFLPENVRVVTSSTPIFGGVGNSFVSNQNELAPTVYIKALSVFGGTDIK